MPWQVFVHCTRPVLALRAVTTVPQLLGATIVAFTSRRPFICSGDVAAGWQGAQPTLLEPVMWRLCCPVVGVAG